MDMCCSDNCNSSTPKSKDEISVDYSKHGIEGVNPGDKVIPSAYCWPAEIISPRVAYEAYEEEVPVIDMAGLNDQVAGGVVAGDIEVVKTRIAAEMAMAAETWGVFNIVNHGVPVELLQRLKTEAHMFFNLPMATKKELFIDKDATTGVVLRGYGFKVERNSTTKCSWSEGLFLANDASFLQDCASKIHSQDCEKKAFVATVLEYETALRKCTMQVLHLLAQGLGVDPKHFDRYSDEGSEMIQRWNYYPPCPEPDKTLGLLQHTDASLVTVLELGDVGGFQVQRGGKWIAVRPQKNGFAILIGDMLEVMTRGKFYSVPHRAVVNKSKPRLSIGNFLAPNRTMEIISPPDLPTPAEQPDTRPEYRPFTFAEYVMHKFSKQPGRAFVRYSMQQKGASTLVA
jgi:isopenicillin N synthase-like dioxygenase